MGPFTFGVLKTVHRGILELAEKFILPQNINFYSSHSHLCDLETPQSLRMPRCFKPHLVAKAEPWLVWLSGLSVGL